MNSMECYEDFPFWMALISIVFSLIFYALGAVILSGFGWYASAIFLLYCLWIEFRILKRSCVNCYYYGKVCGMGKGKLCALFFKKGDPGEFYKDKISWIDLIPDFLVFILPLCGGVILLITNFSLPLLALVILLLIFFSVGNAVMRGTYVCKYCKQKELGCPAEEKFSKK